MGVNPRNPTEKVHIPAATVPKFSAGSGLKSAVKGGRIVLLDDEPNVSSEDREAAFGRPLRLRDAYPDSRILSVTSGHFADRLAAAVEQQGRAALRGPRSRSSADARGRRRRGVLSRDRRRRAPGTRSPSSRRRRSSRRRAPTGWAALVEVCEYARDAGLLVIADAKRGDVPSTAAPTRPRSRRSPTRSRSIRTWATTRSSRSSRTKGSACSRSSRPPIRAARISRTCARRRPAVLAARRGPHRPVGRGPRRRERALQARRGRRRHASRGARDGAQPLPRAVLLLPGVGAQGGRPEDLAAAFTAGPGSALVSASRSVIYADEARAGRRPRRPRPSGSPASCAPLPSRAEP